MTTQHNTTHDNTRQDKTTQHKTAQDNTRQHKTRDRKQAKTTDGKTVRQTPKITGTRLNEDKTRLRKGRIKGREEKRKDYEKIKRRE